MSSILSKLINLAGNLTGVLGLSNGGTAKALAAVNGGLVWSDADSLEITAAGAASQWVLSGGAGTPTMTNTTTTGKTIDGSADEIQLTVQGHSTQTSDIFLAEKSDGTDLLNVTNVNGTKIRGTTTNDDAAAGFVGEQLRGNRASGSGVSLTSTQYIDVASVSITAGDWLVTARVCYNGAPTGGTQTNAGISSTSGNSATGLTQGDNLVNAPTVPVSGSADYCLEVSNFRVSQASTVVWYAKAKANFSGGTMNAYGTITAVRIR